MTQKQPWQELEDEQLQPYFRALAETTPEPDPERLQRTREEFLTLARALRPREERTRNIAPRPLYRKGGFFRWAVALALVLALVWISGVITVRAAEQARPGSPLYPLKRWQETWQLMRARDPQTRIRLHRTFARRRILELRDLMARGQTQQIDPLLEDLLLHVDALAALAREQNLPGPPGHELAAEIETLLPTADAPFQTALLKALNALYQGRRVMGILHQRNANVWQVDGVLVYLTPDTLVQGFPRPGDVVEVVGEPVNHEQWQARWVRVAARASQPSQTAEIVVVGELHPEPGGVWRVGDHRFLPQTPEMLQGLKPETLVEAQLRWDPQRQVWIAVSIKPRVPLTGHVQEIKGYIEAIEPGRIRVNGHWWSLEEGVDVEGQLRIHAPVEIEAWQDTQGNWHVVEVEVKSGKREKSDKDNHKKEHHEQKSHHEDDHEHETDDEELGE